MQVIKDIWKGEKTTGNENIPAGLCKELGGNGLKIMTILVNSSCMEISQRIFMMSQRLESKIEEFIEEDQLGSGKVKTLDILLDKNYIRKGA